MPASNVLTCTPPGSFHPNPTTWTVNPPSVKLSGTPTGAPKPGWSLSVTVPASLPTGQSIHISWSGSTDCATFNGWMDLKVGAPAESTKPPVQPKPPIQTKPPIQQKPPIQPKATAGAEQQYSAMHECTPPVTVAGRSIRVYVQDPTGTWKAAYSQACADARAVARGEKAPGVACSSPAGADYVLCTKRQVTIVGAPYAGPTRCSHVLYDGHRYMVFKQRVTCRYARATALRMLRRQEPYVYEFESPTEGRRWSCRILGNGATERGFCDKRVEERWVLYFPAPLAG
jgi:hypothetical protein